MRITEISEARKNPEQNPKTSINRIVYDAVKSTTDTIADILNVFVSFTKVDKLGINPKSKYETPIGIYAYPAEYVRKVVGGNKRMSTLPFAGDEPHVNMFKATGNIINVATMTDAEVREYYQLISDFWAEMSGEDWKPSLDQIEIFINEAKTRSKHPDYPGGRLWYVTMRVAELMARKLKSKPAITWNKLFRAIGIDGVVDYDSTNGGQGIIHTNEPSQAVFFSTNAIKNVSRHDNAYSSDSISDRQAHGKIKHAELTDVVSKLKTLTDPDEIMDYMTNSAGFGYIKFVDPDIREYIISKRPASIAPIKHPSIRDQRAALTADFKSLTWIKNPSEDLVLSMLAADPSLKISTDLILRKFPKAGERMQRYVLSQSSPSEIRGFEYPHPNIVKKLISMYQASGDVAPAWVLTLAYQFGIDSGNLQLASVKDVKREIEMVTADAETLVQKIETIKQEWARDIKNVPEHSVSTLNKVYQRIVDKQQEELVRLNNRIRNAWEHIKRMNAQIKSPTRKETD